MGLHLSLLHKSGSSDSLLSLKFTEKINFLGNILPLLFSVTPTTDHSETYKPQAVIFATGVLILGGYALYNCYNCTSVTTIGTKYYCVSTMVETEMPEGLSSEAEVDWLASKNGC
jgi:hypothetical protein